MTETGSFNELFARAMRALDIELAFGVMGDANMYIADSFHRLPGGRFCSTANEGGAVLAAAGYAAVSDRVGVATVTHGAIANCVSALFDASRGGYPVLVIAGDTSATEGQHLQNIPQREVVAPTGAEYRELGSARTAGTELADAVRSAITQRRPVVLSIPSDVQQARTSMEMPRPLPPPPVAEAPPRQALEEAAAAIIGSARPLILAGRGARNAESAVLTLAERIGAPLATTLRGKGLFRNDPCHVGICGTLSTPVGGEVIAHSDCVVAFGAGLTALTTLKGELLRGKRVIQVDSDPAGIGRHLEPEVALVGDAGVTATALKDLCDESEADASGFRSAQLADRLDRFRGEDREQGRSTGALTLNGVLHRLDETVPSARTLCIDGGRFSHEALRIASVERPSDYAHCLNVGHIGLSLGYAIGASMGRPDRPALVIAGDGGFMLGGLTEFNTAVRHQANVVLVLLNDGAYGAEYYRFVNQALDPSLTTFEWPSFAEVARALGGRGVRVTRWSDLDDLEPHLRGRGPLLIEVVLDPDGIPDPGEH